MWAEWLVLARFFKAGPVVTQWCAGRAFVNAARAHWIITGRSLTLALVIFHHGASN
jgi:hypothetical protein